MFLIFESKGISKKTKISLRDKIIEIIGSRFGIKSNDIDVSWENDRDTKIKIIIQGKYTYNGIIKNCGRDKDSRKRRASITSIDTLLKANNLKCVYDQNTKSAYLCDNSGKKIFRVTALTPIDDIGLPDSSYQDDTTPIYNDDPNNIVFNSLYSFNDILKKIEKDIVK